MEMPKIIDEEIIMKLEPKIMLWNPRKEDVEMKFDAKVYKIPAGQILKARANVARALLQDYSIYGIVEIQSTESEHLEEKRIEGLTRFYNFLFFQLDNFINWMSEQRSQGRNVLDEPLRVKELKVLIADLEDELQLPRRLNPVVYEEIEKDRKRIEELGKTRRTQSPDINSTSPSLQPKNFEKSKIKKEKEVNFKEKYFAAETVKGSPNVNAARA